MIARLLEGKAKVIATGGGAFAESATRALLNANAVTVWIDAELEVLAERVGRRDTRPLLRGRDPLPVLQALSSARAPLYAEAHLVVRSGAEPPDGMVERILEALAGWQSPVSPVPSPAPEDGPGGR